MPPLPPHRFSVKGKPWRLRYGDPSGDILDPEDDYGAVSWSERLIYLAMDMRLIKNRRRAYETFAHELLHALDEELTHSTIKRLEGPLGRFFYENEFQLTGVPSARGARSSVGCRPGVTAAGPARSRDGGRKR